MIKKLTLTACSLLTIASLAACSGQTSPNAAKDSQSNSTSQPQKMKTSNANATTDTQTKTNTNTASEKPVAPEKNPVGDIPDSQAFVKYQSTKNGYSLVIPEGWARSINGNTVQFVSKLDGVKVTEQAPFATTLTVDKVKTNWIPTLKKNERAVKVKSVTKVNLPAGTAIRVEYTSNSEPNSVTGKQIRLEDNAYLFQKNNKLAILSLWAPYGADNVDQWRKMSKSFGLN